MPTQERNTQKIGNSTRSYSANPDASTVEDAGMEILVAAGAERDKRIRNEEDHSGGSTTTHILGDH